jgi:BirA family biotin operon repressor/biotin-[acetyl-CoA-carboxylase] ligase
MGDKGRATVLRFDSIDSTNLEAMRQAKAGAPSGLCVIARVQTSGRGRQGRTWTSAKAAGLHLTMLLRPRLEMKEWSLITLMAALAVSDTLSRACGLQVDIKWPNDLVFDDHKLSGILCETVDSGEGYAVVLGIGINLYEGSFPAELRDVATSVQSATGKGPDYELVVQELIESIEQWLGELEGENGPERIIQEWCARSSFAEGKRVRVALVNDIFEGVTRGLESDGALRVETSNGGIEVVRAGDVTAVRGMKDEG